MISFVNSLYPNPDNVHPVNYAEFFLDTLGRL